MEMRRPTKRCNSIRPGGCGLRKSAWCRWWQPGYRLLLSTSLLTQKSPCNRTRGSALARRLQLGGTFTWPHRVGVLLSCNLSKSIDHKPQKIYRKVNQKTKHIVRLPQKQLLRNGLPALFVRLLWRLRWLWFRRLWFRRRLRRRWLSEEHPDPTNGLRRRQLNNDRKVNSSKIFRWAQNLKESNKIWNSTQHGWTFSTVHYLGCSRAAKLVNDWKILKTSNFVRQSHKRATPHLLARFFHLFKAYQSFRWSFSRGSLSVENRLSEDLTTC